jgi:hypothetical protein
LTDVESFLYKDEEGQICQPATHIVSALKFAGAKYQIPGQGETTYKNVVGGGSVQVAPYHIPHEFPTWVPDRQQVVLKGQGRIVRTRPRFDKWALTFHIEYDEEEISREMLFELLVYAGKRSGLGDYRPHKGGPFGRFIVSLFE